MRDANIAVSAELATTTNSGIRIKLSINNKSTQRIFVLNRFWRLDKANKIKVDPEKAYRLVKNRTLVVLVGSAPLPRTAAVLYRNTPYASPLGPGQHAVLEIDLEGPIKEYTPYFADLPADKYEKVVVNSVEVLLDYIKESPETVVEGSKTVPGSFIIKGGASNRISTGAAPVSLQVLKRPEAL